MPEQVLLTILHISDLHLGHIIGGPGVAPNDARVRRYIQRWRRFDGLLGHHYDALRALDDFYRRLRPSAPLLVVTGDLTRNGHDLQYALAKQFLGASLPPPFGNHTGLNHAGWSKYTVTGNHDHWPGTDRILGSPQNQFLPLYANPVLRPGISSPDGTTLEFICISTDSEVRPRSLNRFFARGKFDDQLSTAKVKLNDDSKVFRVLVMHHSPFYRDGWSRECEVVSDSGTLDGLLHDKNIRIILCGHIHKPEVAVRHVATSRGSYAVWEARCGTTAVRDDYPKTWRMKSTNRSAEPNSLMIHKVTYKDGTLYWNTQIFNKPRGGMYPDPQGASQPYVHQFPIY